jgi:type IV fimbrial biogenesis protein FimT
MKIKQQGFTLIELVVTVAMAAIILAMGVPSFQETIRNNQLTSNANEFIAALNLTRSEAVKRGVRVVLCKSSDQANCTGAGGYDQGWVVFVDADNDATIDAPGDIVRVFEGLKTGLTLAVAGAPTNDIDDYVAYLPQGMAQSIGGAFQAGTLVLCKDAKARNIVISSTGRARVDTNATC